jgi:hypothetical protein
MDKGDFYDVFIALTDATLTPLVVFSAYGSFITRDFISIKCALLPHPLPPSNKQYLDDR